MIDATFILDGTLPLTGAAITTTRVSTNTIDLLTGRDVGAGEPLGVHVLVTQTFVGGTSLQVSLETCSTSGGTYVPLILSPVILTANLIAGVSGSEIFRYSIPPNEANNATAGLLLTPGEFVRLRYTVVGTFTAGAVFAFINPRQDRNAFTAYAANYTAYVPAAEL